MGINERFSAPNVKNGGGEVQTDELKTSSGNTYEIDSILPLVQKMNDLFSEDDLSKIIVTDKNGNLYDKDGKEILDIQNLNKNVQDYINIYAQGNQLYVKDKDGNLQEIIISNMVKYRISDGHIQAINTNGEVLQDFTATNEHLANIDGQIAGLKAAAAASVYYKEDKDDNGNVTDKYFTDTDGTKVFDITDNDNKISENKNSIDSNRIDINTNKNNISKNASNISDNKNSIDDLKSEVAKKGDDKVIYDKDKDKVTDYTISQNYTDKNGNEKTKTYSIYTMYNDIDNNKNNISNLQDTRVITDYKKDSSGKVTVNKLLDNDNNLLFDILDNNKKVDSKNEHKITTDENGKVTEDKIVDKNGKTIFDILDNQNQLDSKNTYDENNNTITKTDGTVIFDIDANTKELNKKTEYDVDNKYITDSAGNLLIDLNKKVDYDSGNKTINDKDNNVLINLSKKVEYDSSNNDIVDADNNVLIDLDKKVEFKTSTSISDGTNTIETKNYAERISAEVKVYSDSNGNKKAELVKEFSSYGVSIDYVDDSKFKISDFSNLKRTNLGLISQLKSILGVTHIENIEYNSDGHIVSFTVAAYKLDGSQIVLDDNTTEISFFVDILR